MGYLKSLIFSSSILPRITYFVVGTPFFQKIVIHHLVLTNQIAAELCLDTLNGGIELLNSLVDVFHDGIFPFRMLVFVVFLFSVLGAVEENGEVVCTGDDDAQAHSEYAEDG